MFHAPKRWIIRSFSTISQAKTGVLRGIIFLVAVSTLRLHSPELQKVQGHAQGTTYHISWWLDHSPTSNKEKIVQQFQQALEAIDSELSTYRADSYISEFNQSTSTEWIPASDDFLRLISIARDVNAKTSGCYDPTVEPLFDLWGFKSGHFHIPSNEKIVRTKSKLGLDKIKVDWHKKLIRKTLPGVQLDFSSMGEGYTIEKLSEILEQSDITNYLVEFGSDMKVRGHHPSGRKWLVSISLPILKIGDNDPYHRVTINSESGVTIDTSGTYLRSFDIDGKEYSHILDLRLGAPVKHDLVSVSVFGDIPPVSDAWATAMLCLGAEEGAKIARREHISAFFIRRQKDKDSFSGLRSERLISTDQVIFAS